MTCRRARRVSERRLESENINSTLNGVRHGMEYPADKPVMVRRPYQKEATPLDDATDLTVAI